MPQEFLRRLIVPIHVAVLACLISTSTSVAQPKPAPNGGMAVDIVSLKSGKSLRGVIAAQKIDGSITIAVSREWLGRTNPKLMGTALKQNVEAREGGWIQARDRISELLKSPVDSPRLVFFLKQELERIVKLIATPEILDPDFLWFDIRHDLISKVVRTSAERKRIAAFAWNEHMEQVEMRDATALLKELQSRGVKLDGLAPDLSVRIFGRTQDDEEWNARLAIVEYTLSKPLDFQGMNEMLTRTQEGQGVKLEDVIPTLLQQQLKSLLSELKNGTPDHEKGEAKWLTELIRQAEQEKVRGFRVTRLELDPSHSRVTVESRFIAKVLPGQWKTIWRVRENEDATKGRPQAEARIEQDPQVKSAIDTMKSLGLADADGMKQAIRMGAATMSAQQAADSAFAEFRDRYTRHLDGPLLPVNSEP